MLQQLALGVIALEYRRRSLRSRPHLGPPTYGEIAQAVLVMVLVVIFCNQLLPSLLFNRTVAAGLRRSSGPFACSCGS